MQWFNSQSKRSRSSPIIERSKPPYHNWKTRQNVVNIYQPGYVSKMAVNGIWTHAHTN